MGTGSKDHHYEENCLWITAAPAFGFANRSAKKRLYNQYLSSAIQVKGDGQRGCPFTYSGAKHIIYAATDT
jgi:hypothetical protein